MRLIDADYASEAVGMEEFTETLNEFPTIDAEPVVHARWVNGRCSNCGAGVATDCFWDFLSESDNKYCWSCGAKMGEEEDDA